MIQTRALLVDAYRELNAKKMFWITLLISAVVMGAFALLGAKGSVLSLAGMHMDWAPFDALVIYKKIFSWVVVGMWLTWGAIALAVISTAGMFPDLITGGTIDLYLSKPLSRLRLFLTKYVMGLLFVALQVSVSATGCFLVFGFRVGEWKPSIFLLIPLAVCMFSYLFAFSVLIGVWTRSTLAAILLIVLLWAAISGVQYSDKFMLKMDLVLDQQVSHAREAIRIADEEDTNATIGNMFSPLHFKHVLDRKNAVERLPGLEQSFARVHLIHRVVHGIKTVFPKTFETTDMLDRYIFSNREVAEDMERRKEQRRGFFQQDANMQSAMDDDSNADAEMQGIIRNTSPWYIIGTSLGCEAVVLLLAAWIFCRRDY